MKLVYSCLQFLRLVETGILVQIITVHVTFNFCYNFWKSSLSNIGQIVLKSIAIAPYYSYFLGLGRLCPLILIPWVRSPFHFEAHVERVHVGEQPLGRLSLGVPASPTRYFLFKSSHFRPFLAISCYFRQFQDIIDFCNVNNISII